MVEFQPVHIWDCDTALGDLLTAAFEAPIINEVVAQRHNIFAHAVLVLKVDNGRRMHVGEMLEKTDIQATVSSFFILNERG